VRILWVGTKPPWPPEDGGRLVAANTIAALAAAGHSLTVVTASLGENAVAALPDRVEHRAVPGELRSLPLTALQAAFTGAPVSIARHSRAAIRAEVARLLAKERFDVVHAEQAQALPQCEPAFIAGLPVVFRAQNVESQLWGAAADGVAGWLARNEAARFARWEGAAVRRVAEAVALTEPDAARLMALAGQGRHVHAIPAPVAAVLPSAERSLPGDPALVLMGSAGWLPNRRGAEWFVAGVWPRVRQALPESRLHVFGFGAPLPAAEGLTLHPALRDSRDAFPAGAVLVVPLSVASGVRMKILESWARGVPVVATAAAAAGLGAEDGRELLMAEGAEGFAAALLRLRNETGLGALLVHSGRALLERRHDPVVVAAALARVYERASPSLRP
jgi:polysaccharide biosynthesis protein PslH